MILSKQLMSTFILFLFVVMAHSAEEYTVVSELQNGSLPFFNNFKIRINYGNKTQPRRVYFKMSSEGRRVDFISFSGNRYTENSNLFVDYEISVPLDEPGIIRLESELFKSLSIKMETPELIASFRDRKCDGATIRMLGMGLNKIGKYKLQSYIEGVSDEPINEWEFAFVQGDMLSRFKIDPKIGVVGLN
jgi:hypothetical protein